MAKEHLIVFLITTFIFMSGIFLGVFLSKSRVNSIEDKISEFEKNMDSFELSILIEDALKSQDLSCRFLDNKLNETRNQILELGKKAIEYEENAYSTGDYSILKKTYNFVRAKYWLMLEKFKNKCNNSFTTILYFYGTKNQCLTCRDQGFVLSYVASKNPNIYIVPLDKDENITIVNIIKEAFNITKVPTLIINSSLKIEGFLSERNLTKYI